MATVNFGSGLKEIGDAAFSGCDSLNNVVLPEGLKKIGDNAFFSSGIIIMDIPEGVTEIGDYAFGNCASLGSVFFPESIEYCGLYPVSGDVNLPEDKRPTIKVWVKRDSYMDVNFDIIFHGVSNVLKQYY